ncbi:MAG: transglycosylase SLT domain-containing protein, partial [Gammaproteobacteria bacterium]|nr:transglycosylase SLT domain-containing protein [Gammaproteobacteria bacterium]
IETIKPNGPIFPTMPQADTAIKGSKGRLAVLVVAAMLSHIACASDVAQQRELFLTVYAPVERGNWNPVDALSAEQQEMLQKYVLWPDLRAAWLRATLGNTSRDVIEDFLSQYGASKPARELRYQYALHLARSGDLDAYFNIYQQFYQGLNIAKLDCLALRAEIAAGRAPRVVNRAIELWTVGRSQVHECDPVFEFLEDGHHLGPADYVRRFELAIDAREFSMARWLGKSIDPSHIDIASQWLRAQRDPESFVRNDKQWINNESTREQLAYAIERITYDDPELALQLWGGISKGRRFSAEQDYRTERHIALWMARDKLPGAYALLSNLPVAAQNDEVLRWRARTSLRNEDWANLIADIEEMPDAERDAEEWRYWRAIALQGKDMIEQAREILEPLSLERSYYGFLAADELGTAYVFGSNEFVADEDKIAALTTRPDLQRARELFLVGLEGRGRSEWDAVIRHFDSDGKMQAAILADRWGWHSRAIAAAASVGDFDDLALRYPLPYHGTIPRYAEAASISPTWAYAITRSESLFMRDVRSGAGAIGLMQLMPATGRDVARELQLPYSGLETLTDPESNIRLGTTYLGQMAARYGGNQVLATAAYNAGPHRVDAWLPEKGTIDARIWIENIPFNETRGYVRRVLAANSIFHWRMTGEMRRLSDELLLVQAAEKPQQVASN